MDEETLEARGSRDHVKELEAEVAESLPAFPLLADHLQEIAGEVERAVADVCARFQGMVVQARQGVEEAARAMGVAGPGSASLEDGLETARETLEDLLERVVRGSRVSARAIERIAGLERGMKRIGETLDQVDHLASAVRILAVNSAIEAARAGEDGRGFGVVAREISDLARRSAQTSEEIRDIVIALRGETSAAHAELSELADADLLEARRSKDDVSRALSTLSAVNEEMRRSVEAAARLSESLARDIAGAVIALQFQDRVNQQIGHVIGVIREIGRGLARHLDAGAPVGPDEVGRWVEELRRRYTMDSERRVMDRRLAGGTVATDPADSSNIELF